MITGDNEMRAQGVDTFLEAALAQGAGDLTIISDDFPRMGVSGVWRKADERQWSLEEVSEVASRLYGSSSVLGELASFRNFNFAYDTLMSDGQSRRFQVNMMSVLGQQRQGVEIFMRPLDGLADAEGAIQ